MDDHLSSPATGRSESPPPIPFSLFCAYINRARVTQLCSDGPPSYELLDLASRGLERVPAHDREIMIVDIYRRAFTRWLGRHGPEVPELRQLLSAGTANQGMALYRGAVHASGVIPRRGVTGPPELHATLSVGDRRVKLRVPITPEYLTPGSAQARLKGQASVTILGYLERMDEEGVVLRPVFIGDVLPFDDLAASVSGAYFWWAEHEIHVDDIDTFNRVRAIPRPGPVRVRRMSRISEAQVKTAICEILVEAGIPKDWGGEQSDIFSSHLVVEGRRVSAAFLLKGPARATPMSHLHLGKAGDQLVRLFHEPASVFILQHCNQVRPAVRESMQALAVRPGRAARYCVIDGQDTYRLLAAYRKCGLTP